MRNEMRLVTVANHGNTDCPGGDVIETYIQMDGTWHVCGKCGLSARGWDVTDAAPAPRDCSGQRLKGVSDD